VVEAVVDLEAAPVRGIRVEKEALVAEGQVIRGSLEKKAATLLV
jgi:hypothetical protein